MSSIAYLILAHDHPSQLARLVGSLQSSSATFLIHVDRKYDLSPFQQSLPEAENVRYLRDRVSVNWMGFSIVEAILRMAAAAMGQSFRYAVLLSGADYPVKPRDEIETFYRDADKEFICFWRLADRPSWLHKIQYFFPVDLVPIRAWSTGTEPAYWRRFFWGRHFKYQKFMPRRRFIPGATPYGGPDWWSLSRECLEHTLTFVASNPGFVRFYRFTASPGEMFFQTVILNSPFASRVNRFEDYQSWMAHRAATGEDAPRLDEDSFNYRYVDWSGEIDGTREAPAVLNDGDWDKLRSTHCHFARKFDPVRSRSLLQRIDRELLVPNPCPR